LFLQVLFLTLNLEFRIFIVLKLKEMKYKITLALGLLFLVSCGKDQQVNTLQKTSKETKVVTTKKKNKTEDKTVVVDANGVANVTITSNDGMRFDVRKINVSPGQKVRLTLTHTGKLDKRIMGHNVVFLKNGVKPSAFAVKAAAARDNDYIPEETTEVIAHTKMIGGGETTVIEFIAPEAGTYNYICSFPGHYAMMKGKLIVE
jgi:azurin